ncbi:MAG: 50S ribosomal protein L21 [Candidatus Omnitrophica bacterium]|nr:50S ribosomal protein L21 [Candidatus Omnitrophota bacterium]MBU4303233.1 50S ribosomal protein L21 [Candidatus Omnitrophota bacterium]MBU4467205.1 50S ribosomal protein L21 [Candidatus Omnitrophota bacterium]MCG2707303.1 50S ribosomal protein L21 [Candidatus Omnitrophota bacterium]
MYAIIEVGSKQYNVTKDDIIEVNKQAAAKGDNLSIDKVLLVSDGKKVEIGQPYVLGAKVEATVLKQSLGEKTTAYKHRRRKNSHWEKGHRAQLTELKIKSIVLS